MEFLKKLFKRNSPVDYAQLIKDGAVILDVRSRHEFAAGHVPGAVNISVDQLRNKLTQLPDKNRAIITCCASGIRSASAKNILKSRGYVHVYNAGDWTGLKNKV